MIRFRWLVAIHCLVYWAAPSCMGQQPGSQQTQSIRPNVLFILADDLAWSDLACYGHPWHETPHLDRLAKAGLRFTDAYAAAPICSASRAALLTGKTTARVNFEFVTKRMEGYQQIDQETLLRAPPFTLNLPRVEQTIAEHLNQLDYQTAFFGKWHLNAHHERYLGWSPTHGPPQQGFSIAQEDFGNHPYAWGPAEPKAIVDKGQFADDSMVERIVDFVRQPHRQPYFVMASSFYVHTPVRSRCQWLLDKYSEKIPADARNRARRIPYAAFLETLDHHVGRILAALEESGQADNTLVLFTSDNGGHPKYTGNGPLRGSKWNLYEGGVRVPMIVRWPGKVQPGTQTSVPVVGYDLLPTFVQTSGGDVPSEVDGVSFFGVLKGDQELQRESPIVWHFPYYHPERGYRDAQEQVGVDDFAVSKTRPQSAMRWGKHKLLLFHEDRRVELYNLEDDQSEQRDLAETQPELAKRLTGELLERLDAMQARLPTPADTPIEKAKPIDLSEAPTAARQPQAASASQPTVNLGQSDSRATTTTEQAEDSLD